MKKVQRTEESEDEEEVLVVEETVLEEVEKVLVDFIDNADSILYKTTGFHIPGYKWSANTMNKCYRCRNKKEDDPVDLLSEISGHLFKSSQEESFFSFCLRNGFIFLLFVVPGVYFYYWWISNRCN